MLLVAKCLHRVHRFVHPPLSLLCRHLSGATISSYLLVMHRFLSSRFVRAHPPRTTSSRKIRSFLDSSASYKHNTSFPQVKKQTSSRPHTPTSNNRFKTITTMLLFITTILATSGALAAPMTKNAQVDITTVDVTSRSAPLADNTSSCSGYNDAFWNVDASAFTVTIGRPYLGGSRCGLIEEKIAQDFNLTGLKCKGSKDNTNTVITIASNMKAANLAKINTALNNAYPEIDFNCPTALKR